ncbi:hypothetical protein F4801DRAFT_309053 [Xylaria longipes]|nr:hypothetical protein F4801DRAFT_309053 [Xylaria longipes]
MVKNPVVRNGLLPRKRRTSLSGFFSKILPSNRPEKGGTTRIEDMTGETDSAYEDLGMNPNQLTEWNLAQERSPGLQPPGTSAQGQHHRGQSWSMQQGRTRLRADTGRFLQVPQLTPDFDLARPPMPPEPPGLKPPHHVQHEKSQPITREEIQNTLREKEDTRKHRRSLKESGDWLGVQGADPYSGEFAVLTPTSTLSSETTPPHTRERLAELSRKQQFSKLAYDEAKCKTETEREKVRFQMGQSKLEKIEGAKEELRQQQEFPTWIQHKRRWSSAAEPELSPIPQSLESYRMETNSDEVATGPIRNFSRPPKSSGESDVREKFESINMVNNSENTEPSKHNHRRSPSTDTIVHKSLMNMGIPDTSMKTTKVLYPSVFSDTDDSPVEEQRSKNHFLWRRRRRMTNPEKLVKRLSSLITHSSAGETVDSLESDSSVRLPPPTPRLTPVDHIKDVLIPDSHLHLKPCPKRMVKTGNSPDPMKRNPFLFTATSSTQGSHSEAQNNSALRVATNLIDYRELQELQLDLSWGGLDTSGATAISSQSRLKGNTKSTETYRGIIPLRSSSAQARLVQPQVSQIQNHGTSQTQNHANRDLPGHTPDTRNLRQPSSRTVFLEDYTNGQMTGNHERDPGGFASTPIITITGFDPEPQPPLEETQSHMEPWNNREGTTIRNDESPATPSPQSWEQELYNASATDEEWETATSSRPKTPQRNSQSFELAHETPETDTASTSHATLESGPTSPAQHHEMNQYRDIQFKASNINEAVAVPHHPRAKRMKLIHRRQKSDEHRDAMIQDAARIAMQRSRAREITTTSRTPSPLVQDAQKATCVIRRPRYSKANIPVINAGVLIEQEARRRQLKSTTGRRDDGGYGIRGTDAKPGPIVILVSHLMTVGMTALGLAGTVWSVARPAFDARSHLWRRRRRGESTFEDHAVFIIAGMFIAGAAVVVAALVRAVPWIVLHL